jgi:ABC-type molybdate transport system substrate-binding protein
MYWQICCSANAAARNKHDDHVQTQVACVATFVATALLAWDLPQAPAQTPGGHVVVFAVASLKNALGAISEEWHRETGKNAVLVCR